MKKVLRRLISLIGATGIAFFGWRFKIKNAPSDYVDLTTKAIVAMEGVKKKNFAEIRPFAEAVFPELSAEDFDALEQNKKYIKKLWFILDGTAAKKDIPILVADPGLYYYPLLMRLKTFLDGEKGVYRLKEEFLAEAGDQAAFLRTLRCNFANGLIFVGQEAEDIAYFQKKPERRDKVRSGERKKDPMVILEDQKCERIRSLITEQEKKFVTAVYDFPGENALGLDMAAATLDAGALTFTAEALLLFDREIVSPFYDSSDERKLTKLKGTSWIYLSLRNFSDIEAILMTYDVLTELGDDPEKAARMLSGPYRVNNSTKEALFFIELLSGVSIAKELANIDREILFSPDERTLSAALKDTDRAGKLTGKLKVGGDALTVDAAKKIVNVKISALNMLPSPAEPTAETLIPVLKKQFFSARIATSLLTPFLEDGWEALRMFPEISGKGSGNRVEIKASCTLEAYARELGALKKKNP
ncbi:MAG: hypothetical protein LBQ97_07795 [Fusobacteriaceae bacterium]|jgi:hypothetical protein|nr:hypothetical protein [Fusobacteriaceae bacterium]